MTLLEAAKQALEALESSADNECAFRWYKNAATELRQAIEQAEKQEPVAYLNIEIEGTGGYLDWDNDIPAHWYKSIPLYAAPSQTKEST